MRRRGRFAHSPTFKFKTTKGVNLAGLQADMQKELQVRPGNCASRLVLWAGLHAMDANPWVQDIQARNQALLQNKTLLQKKARPQGAIRGPHHRGHKRGIWGGSKRHAWPPTCTCLVQQA